MRKIFNYALVALLAFGMASCTKEDDTLNGGNNPTQKLSFKFDGINGGATTYAQIAQNDELTLANASVYLFNSTTGKLAYVEGAIFGAGENVIDVGVRSELQGVKYHAYIVANNLVGASITTATDNKFVDLTGIAVGTTSESDFVDEVTTAITAQVDRNLFLMTGVYSVGGVKTALDPIGEYPVTLKRRVARFDLLNESPGAIDIKKVVIRKAANLGNVFGESTYDATTDGDYTTIAKVEYDIEAMETATTITWDQTVDNTDPLNPILLKENATSVFYLNPILLKADNSAAEIFVEAEINGNTQVFQLEFKDNQQNDVTEINLQANYRYILRMIEDFKFVITVADWFVDPDFDVIETGKVKAGKLGLAANPTLTDATFNANAFAVKATGATLNFTMTAASSAGTSHTLTPEVIAGYETYDASKITVTPTHETTVTYSTPYFASKYKIEVAAIDAAKSFSTTLTITDEKSGESVDYRIYYYGTDNPIVQGIKYPASESVELDAVVLGGIVWAPVNVGATIIDDNIGGSVTTLGFSYQFCRNSAPKKPSSTATALLKGPLTEVEALANPASFIFSTTGNWLANGENYESIFNLWTPEINDSPCPSGWRVPTAGELEILHIASADNYYPANSNGMTRTTYFMGDDNTSKLYFPLAGQHKQKDGTSDGYGGKFCLWSSTIDIASNGEPTAYGISMHHTASKTFGLANLATGRSIRCVYAE